MSGLLSYFWIILNDSNIFLAIATIYRHEVEIFLDNISEIRIYFWQYLPYRHRVTLASGYCLGKTCAGRGDGFSDEMSKDYTKAEVSVVWIKVLIDLVLLLAEFTL